MFRSNYDRKIHTVTIRLNDSDYKWLQKTAEKKRLEEYRYKYSISQLIRNLIYEARVKD